MQSKWGAQPPFPAQMYEKRVAKLPQGAAPLYSTQGRNEANENSAVMISFQVCATTLDISQRICWQIKRAPHEISGILPVTLGSQASRHSFCDSKSFCDSESCTGPRSVTSPATYH